MTAAFASPVCEAEEADVVFAVLLRRLISRGWSVEAPVVRAFDGARRAVVVREPEPEERGHLVHLRDASSAVHAEDVQRLVADARRSACGAALMCLAPGTEFSASARATAARLGVRVIRLGR